MVDGVDGQEFKLTLFRGCFFGEVPKHYDYAYVFVICGIKRRGGRRCGQRVAVLTEKRTVSGESNRSPTGQGFGQEPGGVGFCAGKFQKLHDVFPQDLSGHHAGKKFGGGISGNHSPSDINNNYAVADARQDRSKAFDIFFKTFIFVHGKS